MYNNSSHYSSGYPNAYQQYPTSYDAAAYNYQGYSQYQNQPTQLVPPGENTYPQSESNWSTSGYGSTPKDAVAQEMQQQKAQLVKQREDYVRKVSVLRRELDQLRMQKQDLLGDERSSKRDLANILKENDKLQDEIQGKMKAIQNVIEMLSSIIKDGQSIADLEAALAEKEQSRSSPAQSQSQSDDRYQKEPNDRYNYVHYDSGLHWCRLCDEFPDTAKDFLMHLQEKGHQESAKENDVDNTPWHKLPAEATLDSYEDAPVKRVPIKGLQFFISAPSWYCKLCDVWIGDLHCASHHLKSKVHYQNYENFVSQNPHWEVEWLKDRDKAMERKGAMNSSDDSDHHRSSRKRRKDKNDSKDKKKKKRSKKRRRKSSDSSSSSSSSDSSSEDEKTDRSKSIRVTMRNVKSIMDEDLSGKWSVLEKLVEEHKKKQEEVEKLEREKKEKGNADPLINQWMTVSHGQEKDKVMFNSLKDRMKQKQEQEKAKQMEVDRKKREKEQEELERLKKREKEEREAAEEKEIEMKRREVEEMNRIRDKEKNQLKFKTNYRKRNSMSRSDDEEREKYFREEREKEQKERYRRDSGRDRSSSKGSRDEQSRSPSTDRKNGDSDKKKSYKRLPFIGRMPLFKNRKMTEEKDDKTKEIQKESYEPQRRTRFEPGNLPRAFMPRPDVVCFPRLSSIPPLTMPPPEKVEAPAPPTISEALQREVDKEEAEDEVAMEEDEEEEEAEPPLEAPPPPKIDSQHADELNLSDDEVLYGNSGEDMGQYYQEYSNAMYSQDMYYQGEGMPPPPPSMVPRSHTLPLEPPPLPPDDDLAMLGICADDMAAQSF